jgi:hypothetical protein
MALRCYGPPPGDDAQRPSAVSFGYPRLCLTSPRRSRSPPGNLPAQRLNVHGEMVLEILAHAGQIHPGLEVDLAEVVRLTDAREHEQLRRVEDAAGQQHLAGGRDPMEAPAPGVLDARRPRALEDHPGGEGARLDGEVRSPHGRAQEGHGGAAAPTVPDGPLTIACPASGQASNRLEAIDALASSRDRGGLRERPPGPGAGPRRRGEPRPRVRSLRCVWPRPARAYGTRER